MNRFKFTNWKIIPYRERTSVINIATGKHIKHLWHSLKLCASRK